MCTFWDNLLQNWIHLPLAFDLVLSLPVPDKSVQWLPIRIQSEFFFSYLFFLKITVCMQTSSTFFFFFFRRLETNLVIVLEIFLCYQTLSPPLEICSGKNRRWQWSKLYIFNQLNHCHILGGRYNIASPKHCETVHSERAYYSVELRLGPEI